jgi:hypothetical protein
MSSSNQPVEVVATVTINAAPEAVFKYMINQTGLIHYRVNYSLSSNSQQTKIICNTTIETYQKPLHFAAPILSVLAKRELQSDLQALKVAVEKNIS